MYKVVYTKGTNTAYFKWFDSFNDAATFSLEQKFIIEIKYYDTKTPDFQN